jgi:hypothetical protein
MSLMEPEITSPGREPFDSNPLESNEPFSDDFAKHERAHSFVSEKLKY